jgi:hypothetical protein
MAKNRLISAGCAGALFGALAAPAVAQERRVEVLDLAPATVTPNLRDQPKVDAWQPGDPIKEIPRRWTRATPVVPPPTPMVDPLLALQATRGRTPDAIGAPVLNFNGGGFSGVNPPDTVGDVGLTQYVQMINFSSGSQIRVWNKAGTLVAGPTALDSLGTGNCASGLGDPIVLWDQDAQRWLLSEFSSGGNRMCVYISQTSDATGAYFAYQFTATNFPDYPKYAVWPDAYYVGTNENSPAVYALQRSAMLTGAVASSQRFIAPDLSGFPFQMVPPADWDGATPPPAGAPAVFLRHRDSESHGSPGAADTLQLFEFHVDFATPANSTFTGPVNINIAEIDSDLCGLSSFSCIPQPSGANPLDPLREVVMNRPQYRNRGTHQVMVGSFATDITGTNQAGTRWFELRKTGASWTLFQEGTIFTPVSDTTNRWMATTAMDGTGNIAVAYNVSSSTVFPGLRYTGRLSTDPAGTMGSEQTIIAGTASNASIRYGDYASITVDPVNDCTFWVTGEWNAATQWSTRVATFRFPAGECIDVPVELQGFSIE